MSLGTHPSPRSPLRPSLFLCPLSPPVLRCERQVLLIEIQGIEMRAALNKQLLLLLLQHLFPAGRREPTTGLVLFPVGHPTLSLGRRDPPRIW